MKRLTHKFLESLADAMNTLDHEASPKSFNPVIALTSALILTGTAAFSRTPRLPLLILLLSIILLQSTRSPMDPWIKLQLFILSWAIVVGIPLPFITEGKPLTGLYIGPLALNVSSEGLEAMLSFVTRVLAAAGIFTSLTYIIGWRGAVKGMEGLKVPREVTFLLGTSIIYIPLFLREAVKMLSAREARLIAKPKLRDAWRLIATIVGDLILRGYEHSWRLEKAIRARSFAMGGALRGGRVKVNANDIALFSVTLMILALKLKFAW
ncbi:hypothetical protein KEJ44_08440 [Candidatus Bathyarchaeota archaeon]|nr:hypothetical protein [Candidatus Bathyarchaeota archaeon]